MNSAFRLIALIGTLTGPLMSLAGPIPYYSIWEQGNALLTDIPGASICGVKDDWTLTLPQGWAWNGGTSGITAPENPNCLNRVVAEANSGVLLWQSAIWKHDLDQCLQDSAALGACTANGLSVRVQVVSLERPNCVPDSAATGTLLSLSLLGMFGAVAFSKRLRPDPSGISAGRGSP